MSDPTVEYRPIEGFPRYRVGDDGSLWSFRTSRCFRKNPWKKLNPSPNKKGYLNIILIHEGKRKTVHVHVLVLTAFRGQRPEGMESCHWNGIKADCRLENLRWDTHKANMDDRARHGGILRELKHPNAKITPEMADRVTAMLSTGARHKDIAAVVGISPGSVWSIRHGTHWTVRSAI